MKRISFTLYKFEELSNKAKLTAVQLHRKAFLGEKLFKTARKNACGDLFFKDSIKQDCYFSDPKFDENGEFSKFENVEFHLVDDYHALCFASDEAKLELDKRHIGQMFKASFDGENVTVTSEINDETSKFLADSIAPCIKVYITSIYRRQRDYLFSFWQSYDHIAYALTYEMTDLWFLADGRVATEHHLAFLN